MMMLEAVDESELRVESTKSDGWLREVFEKDGRLRSWA